jgi:hypothetical protein
MNAAKTVSEFYVYLVTLRRSCELYVEHEQTENQQ